MNPNPQGGGDGVAGDALNGAAAPDRMPLSDVLASCAVVEKKEHFPTLHEIEVFHIAVALREAGFHQREAAKLLGISRWSLGRRIKDLGWEKEVAARKGVG